MASQVKTKTGEVPAIEQMYSIEEIAELASVRPRQVRRWTQEGALRYVQLPRGRRIPASAWAEFVAENTRASE